MPAKVRLEKLSSPGQIGKVKTRNRMVKPGQSMHFATEEGYISEVNLGFYETIARGGVGLVVVEMAGIAYPVGYPSIRDLRIDDDRFIPRLSELAGIIHKHGAATFLQLNHCGPNQKHHIDGAQPKAASTLGPDDLPRITYGPSLELTIAEIEDIVDKFARGAERARKAGFDGVEVHAAHGYLLNSFLSAAWNRRQDKYGGSKENRARFAGDVIRAIKQRAGADFAVGIRVNGAEYGVKDGLTPKEVQDISRMLQAAGADCIHVSAFGFGPYNRVNSPEQLFYPEAPKPLGEGLDGSRKGPGGLTLLAAGVKKAVSIPVITVGRIDPILAEKVLQEGRADFVAMGRCLMADPEAPRKAVEGRVDEIRPCTACLTCVDRYTFNKVVVCRANASLGKEREYVITPAAKKKRVMVIGGGPAGMEVARVAALRGHEVTLYEKENRLGGSMNVVSLVKGLETEDLSGLTRFFRVQLQKLGVKVNLGKEAGPALIAQVKPDVVVLAQGGTPTLPDIPGINRRVVVSQERLHKMVKPYLRLFGPGLLRSLTKYYLPIGKRVVIIGGGIQGIELAEFLVKRGRQVTVTEPSDQLGAEMVDYTRQRLLVWLRKKGATLLTGVKYDRITDRGLTITDKEGKKQTLAADTIVTALPLVPNGELFSSLKGKVPEVYLIGDSREPHLIVDAVAEGLKTALAI